MTLDRSTLAPGLRIPPFSRVGNFDNWNRFAAANYEFAGHHMDDEIGRHEGFGAAIGMAPLIFAYMHDMLRDWVGPEGGSVASVQFKLRAPFLRSRILTASGVVTGVAPDGDRLRVDLDVWAEDDQGARLVEGSAAVALL